MGYSIYIMDVFSPLGCMHPSRWWYDTVPLGIGVKWTSPTDTGSEKLFLLWPMELLRAILYAWCLVLGRHFRLGVQIWINHFSFPFDQFALTYSFDLLLFYLYSVRKQLVNIPSFIVRLDSQKHIDFALRSPFGGGRAGRVKRKNLKKGTDGGDAGEEDDE